MRVETQITDATYYLHGVGLHGQMHDDEWTYFGTDAMGSVRQSYDASGVPGYTPNSFDPYGQPLTVQTVDTPYGFTGQYTDATGLQHLRARYYNPTLGTFTQRDPVQGVMGGASIRWNPYIYAHANPVNLTDPSGRFPPLLVAAAIGAVIWSSGRW